MRQVALTLKYHMSCEGTHTQNQKLMSRFHGTLRKMKIKVHQYIIIYEFSCAVAYT